MFRQIRRHAELLQAHRATIFLFTRVLRHVSSQTVGLMETSIAQFTRIRFAAFVVSHVLLEIVGDGFEAHWAFLDHIALGKQTLLAVVRFYVHIQIDLTAEGLVAHVTFELFVGIMDQHMFATR